MAYRFDLVCPERQLASVDVQAIELPGEDGDLVAMENHVPTIITLRPGLVKTTMIDGSVVVYVISGGIAEIGSRKVSVLAEQAYASANVTETVLNTMYNDIVASLGIDASDRAQIVRYNIGIVRGYLGL